MVKIAQQQADVDLAHQILQQHGQAMYFRDLIAKVLEAKGCSGLPAKMAAEIHTQINMDSRFVHIGKGMWGLAEWLPQRRLQAEEETAAAMIPEPLHQDADSTAAEDKD